MVSFEVEEGQAIIVKINGQFLFRQYWHDFMSFDQNLASAARSVKRIERDMVENARRAAEAGRQYRIHVEESIDSIERCIVRIERNVPLNPLEE